MTASLADHADADRCHSLDSNFVICLSANTRGADQSAANEEPQSPTSATTPNLGAAIEPRSAPSLPPTVPMRSPTVSAVVTAARSPLSGSTAAKKVVKTSRKDTPKAETLKQKQRSDASKNATTLTALSAAAAVVVEKAVSVLPAGGGHNGNGDDGLLQEENKAPSPARATKHPLGLPPLLRRARTSSAQPASGGKQAAAQATPAMPAAPALGFKRGITSVSPIGLGGAALPLPPSKRPRTVSTSPAAPAAALLAAPKSVEQRQKQLQQTKRPESGGQNQRKKAKSVSLKTSFRIPQQHQPLDLPLKTTSAAPPVQQRQQQQRASRRHAAAAAAGRNSASSGVPNWVQRAASAPQVNTVLLSAAEKIEPASTSPLPAWKFDNKKAKREERANGSDPNKIKNNKDSISNALFVPGWEALYQIADAAPREYEDCETVAEILTEGAEKLEKFKAQKEYASPSQSSNFNNSSAAARGGRGGGGGNAAGPSNIGHSNSTKKKFNSADRSLYRQGFGFSEFAARMGIVASKMTPEEAEKESIVERAIRVLHANGTPAITTKNTKITTVTNCGEDGGKEEKNDALDDGVAEEERERGGGLETIEKTTKNNDLSPPNANDATDAAVEQQKQQQRAPFAIGHAISNAIAPLLRAGARNNYRNNHRPGNAAAAGGGVGVGGNLGNAAHGISGTGNTARLGPGKYIRGVKFRHNNSSQGGGITKRPDGKKPGPKLRSGAGGGTTSSRRRNNTSLAGLDHEDDDDDGEESEEEEECQEEETRRRKLMPPPTIWPPSETQFVSKGSWRSSVNVNDLARVKTLSGSGLDMQLWKKLWKEQAAEASRKK